jgi:xanthine dehydrogenase YagR molybdenum-binding subunit
VLSDMTDIGTGTYTILSQIAAECLGLPLDRVRIELGRSDLPTSWGSGGSWGASSAGMAVHRACELLREKLVTAATSDPRSPLQGLDNGEAIFSGGWIAFGSTSESLSDLVARRHPDGLEAEGESTPTWVDPNFASHSIHTYGAHFAEVGVDADTGDIRIRQMLGVFSPGRILNAKTARSQHDVRSRHGVAGRSHRRCALRRIRQLRSGEYLVPVHADIPAIDAVMLDGFDDKANALGIKGGDTPLLWALRDVLGMTVPSSATAWRCAGQY